MTEQKKYKYIYVVTCASWDKTIETHYTDLDIYDSFEVAQSKMYKKANSLHKFYCKECNSELNIWDTGANINIDNGDMYFWLRIHKRKNSSVL